MFTVKTNFGEHRVTAPAMNKTYLYNQFPQDMQVVLSKLVSVESLLMQLVETINQFEQQPPARFEGQPSAINTVLQSTFGDIRGTLETAAEIIVEDVTKDDIDVNSFLDFQNYLPGGSQTEFVQRCGTFINTPVELEAFDSYLIDNEDKADLFKEYLQQKMFRANDMEKVIRGFISDECFLDYNYKGALGKNPLHQMMLFENIFFNICYSGDNHDEYINELKKIIHRAKNRVYKNRSIVKAKESLEVEYRLSNPEEPEIASEVEVLNATFTSALSNDTSTSQIFPISDTLKLEALDRLLKNDEMKLQQFRQFLKLLMVKHEDPDKVLLEITAPEVYLRFNYSGTAQKKALKDMILFDQLFFEICFKDLSFEDYVQELKKVILRNKNRAYKIVSKVPESSKRDMVIAEEDELLESFEFFLEDDLKQVDLANSRVFPINSPARLEALDDALRSNSNLKIHLQHHVTKCYERFFCLDKVIPRFVTDPVFMEYNYAGVWTKNALKDHILFQKVFYEVCYKGQPFPIYVKELIRIIQVSKNRVHRKNAMRKRSHKPPSTSKIHDETEEEMLAADAYDEFSEELNRLDSISSFTNSTLFPIRSTVNLKAFDRCLQTEPEKRQRFIDFLRKLGNDLDKVIEQIIKDELFLDYNYQGIKGKRALSEFVLIDQVFYEAFGVPEGMPFQKYIKQIKKCCRRASNRVNKKRGLAKKALAAPHVMKGHLDENGEIVFDSMDIETEEVIETDEDMTEDEEESR